MEFKFLKYKRLNFSEFDLNELKKLNRYYNRISNQFKKQLDADLIKLKRDLNKDLKKYKSERKKTQLYLEFLKRIRSLKISYSLKIYHRFKKYLNKKGYFKIIYLKKSEPENVIYLKLVDKNNYNLEKLSYDDSLLSDPKYHWIKANDFETKNIKFYIIYRVVGSLGEGYYLDEFFTVIYSYFNEEYFSNYNYEIEYVKFLKFLKENFEMVTDDKIEDFVKHNAGVGTGEIISETEDLEISVDCVLIKLTINAGTADTGELIYEEYYYKMILEDNIQNKKVVLNDDKLLNQSQNQKPKTKTKKRK